LEARWAVYFDTMGIEYEYENEGYDLDDAGWYLPDFWFPRINMYAEVKGQPFTDEEYRKAAKLENVLMLVGVPEYKTYYVANSSGWEADYLLFNENLYEITDEYLHHTEYYGLMPDEMKPMVIEKYGGIIRKGINAARSARFEHGETPIYNNRSQKTNDFYDDSYFDSEEFNQEWNRVMEREEKHDKINNIRTCVVIKNDISSEDDVKLITNEEGFMISPMAVHIILSCENPVKLLEHVLNTISDDVLVIEPDHIDLRGFERRLNGA